VYGIDALADLCVPKLDRYSIAEQYQQFQHDVDHVTIQIRIRSAQSDRQALSDWMIRPGRNTPFHREDSEAIRQSELPDDKRDALYDKLNKFATEVDKGRTASKPEWLSILPFATP